MQFAPIRKAIRLAGADKIHFTPGGLIDMEEAPWGERFNPVWIEAQGHFSWQ